MTKITYVEAGGEKHTLEVEPGLSVMQGAVRNDVPGIDADCGGACACATCHVYVAPEWAARLASRGEMEESMLGFVAGVEPRSRLSCQIKVTEALEGLVVHIPPKQR